MHPVHPAPDVDAGQERRRPPVPGACWYAPEVGKALPTESEWERAARGGLEGARLVTRRTPTGDGWRIPGRESFLGRTSCSTAIPAPLRSARFRPTGMACTT